MVVQSLVYTSSVLITTLRLTCPKEKAIQNSFAAQWEEQDNKTPAVF